MWTRCAGGQVVRRNFSFHRLSRTLPLFGFGPKNASMKPSGFLDCPGKPEKESGTASTITCGEEGEGRVRDERTTDFNPRPSLSRLCESGGRRMPDSGARTFPLCAFFARTTPFCTPQSPANRVTRPGTPAADARAGIATERPTTAGFFIDFATTAFPAMDAPMCAHRAAILCLSDALLLT